MRKTFLFAGMAFALILSACSNSDIKEPESNNQAEKEETTMLDNSLELYEEFLNNNAKVHIDVDADQDSIYFDFGDDKEQYYNLEELINTIIERHFSEKYEGEAWLSGVSYAYIDCGNDGSPELALKISTPMGKDGYVAEGWMEYLVIKDIDGQLRSIYSDIAWSRSRINLNEYGYLCSDGSGGAVNQVFEKAFLDSAGKLHYIYRDLTTSAVGWGAELWVGRSISIPSGVVDEKNYVILQFDFNNTSDDYSDDVFTYVKYVEDSGHDVNEGVRGYFWWDLIDDESIYDLSNPLRLLLENEGLTVVSRTEIDKMIADKEKSEGLTDEIKNGKQAEWTDLEITFETVSKV